MLLHLFIFTHFIGIILSTRLYSVKLTVDDDHEWITSTNGSVYFWLSGSIKDSPLFEIENGLPNSKNYNYSILLDDIGDIERFYIYHTDKNVLCLESITIDDKITLYDDRNYDCQDTEKYGCQYIHADFVEQKIVDLPNHEGFCNISPSSRLKQYDIQIILTTDHDFEFYNDVFVSVEGFPFNAYYTPFYNISADKNNILQYYEHDVLEISFITYDIYPMQSLVIINRNESEMCIKSVFLNDLSLPKLGKMNTSPLKCISYQEFDANDTNLPSLSSKGCEIATFDFNKERVTTKSQLQCELLYEFDNFEEFEQSSTTTYTMTIEATEGTSDYVFYQMEGHYADGTECFYTKKHELPKGRSIHKFFHMKNIGNPRYLHIVHDRANDFCFDSIKVHSTQTNDTIFYTEELCSDFLIDEEEEGSCNVITIDFELNNATNVISNNCPWKEICQFGLYESPYGYGSSSMAHVGPIIFLVIAALIIIFLLTFVFGYKCLWCNGVYGFLIHCWDPFVNDYWNLKCGNKRFCCYCSNTTDMQHNLCCYCCGCDYCNPFSVHRRRVDKKKANKIAKERKKRKQIDEYDTEDGDALTAHTRHKYDVHERGSLETINLGDNIPNDIEHRRNDDDDDEDDSDDINDSTELQHHKKNINIYDDDDDSESTELQLKTTKGNQYSQVVDAPEFATMYDDGDDMANSGVVDHYDDPELR